MKQAGLDLGSLNTKLVVLLKAYVQEHGEKPEKFVVTGYGRVNFPEGRISGIILAFVAPIIVLGLVLSMLPVIRQQMEVTLNVQVLSCSSGKMSGW